MRRLPGLIAAAFLLAAAAGTLATADTPLLTGAEGIGPGSRILTRGPGLDGSCTANFVWTDGARTFLGSAGHCFMPPAGVSTHGPDANYPARLTTTHVCVRDCVAGSTLNATLPGTFVKLGPLVYARQPHLGVEGEDFGLVEVPEELLPLVRTTLPVWGGPVAEGAAEPGERLCHYGAGIVSGDSAPTMARAGVAGRTYEDEGVFHAFLAATPGDSGSAVVTCAPDAEGVLVGIAAVGLITALAPAEDGNALGTTIAFAKELAAQAGLQIHVLT